ncbi:MAG: hypothetical protein P4L40_09900, partial [Terracidiphilus sp.]|nr:hypothetical protein [Terracidiphilus sp.]
FSPPPLLVPSTMAPSRVAVMALFALQLCSGLAQECGPLANGASCPEGCCSQWGFCGATSDYCSLDQNCQASYGSCWTVDQAVDVAPAQPAEPAILTECGPTGGGAACEDGACCSPYGWCGTTEAYCAPDNCQSGYGLCWDSNIAPVAAALAPVKPYEESYECGAVNGASCPTGCCSLFGWCGTSNLFCDASLGCQIGFGQCNSGAGTSLPIYADPLPVAARALAGTYLHVYTCVCE